jgi:hyperosmotically inducible protein
MKTTKQVLAAASLAVGMMLGPVAAYAADGDMDRADPKLFVKDSVITTKIKAKLASEHLGSLKHIQIDTDQNGVVWMTGTANTQQEIDQAVAIAKNTEGVKTVKANLKVQKDK